MGTTTRSGDVARTLASATTEQVVRSGAPGATGVVAGSLVAFALASAAQGIPFVVVMATVTADASTGWVVAIASARVLPYLLCSPFAGSLASRLEVGAVWLWTGVARSALIAASGCAIALGAPPVVGTALVFVIVAAGTPTYPTLMRLLHERIPSHRWGHASATAAGVESAAFWAGPAIGGGLLLASPFVAIGVGFVLSVVAIASGRSTFLARPQSLGESGPDERVVSKASTGPLAARSVLTHPSARPAVIAMLGVNVLAGMVAALLVDIGREFADDRAYGTLSLANGLGALTAFVVALATVGRRHRPMAALATAGVGIIALGLAGGVTTAAIAMAAFGASVLWAEVLGTVVVGAATCSRSVAAAIGLLDSWIVAAMLLGTLAAPLLTHAASARVALVIAGAIGVCAAACARSVVISVRANTAH